eukprot:g81612.t1
MSDVGELRTSKRRITASVATAKTVASIVAAAKEAISTAAAGATATANPGLVPSGTSATAPRAPCRASVVYAPRYNL